MVREECIITEHKSNYRLLAKAFLRTPRFSRVVALTTTQTSIRFAIGSKCSGNFFLENGDVYYKESRGLSSAIKFLEIAMRNRINIENLKNEPFWEFHKLFPKAIIFKTIPQYLQVFFFKYS